MSLATTIAKMAVFKGFSDFHLPRARAVVTIILGIRGIMFTPMEARTKRDREPTVKILRDIGRSIIWIFSGYSYEKHSQISLRLAFVLPGVILMGRTTTPSIPPSKTVGITFLIML